MHVKNGTSSLAIITILEAIATAANGLQTLLHNLTSLMHLFGHKNLGV